VSPAAALVLAPRPARAPVRLRHRPGLIGAGLLKIYSDGPLDLGAGGSKGRLLRVRGRARLPARARGDGWHDDAVPALAMVSERERRVLAEAWLVAAQTEHASIPAFAQLSLQLAALGASSDLVEATHRAALDEIRHARRCYALARAFGGEAWTRARSTRWSAPPRPTRSISSGSRSAR
jgi:hypothetical protein